MDKNKKIPKQSDGTDALRDKGSKANGPPFYFWKWLAENHPVIDLVVWATVMGMSLASICISVYSILFK